MARFSYAVLVIFILVACQSKTNSDTSSSDEGVGPDSGLSDLADSLDDIPTDTPEQAAAVGDAKDGLSDLLDLYGNLKKGMSAARLRSLLTALASNRARLQQIADELRKAGLAALADAFDEIAAKREVFRYYNAVAGRHFHATDAVPPAGFTLEGFVFRIYEHPRRSCNVAMYRCYLASGNDHYWAREENCGGGQVMEKIGFICPKEEPRAALPLYRAYKEGDHVETTSKDEIALLQNGGFQIEGALGFAPN